MNKFGLSALLEQLPTNPSIQGEVAQGLLKGLRNNRDYDPQQFVETLEAVDVLASQDMLSNIDPAYLRKFGQSISKGMANPQWLLHHEGADYTTFSDAILEYATQQAHAFNTRLGNAVAQDITQPAPESVINVVKTLPFTSNISAPHDDMVVKKVIDVMPELVNEAPSSSAIVHVTSDELMSYNINESKIPEFDIRSNIKPEMTKDSYISRMINDNINEDIQSTKALPMAKEPVIKAEDTTVKHADKWSDFVSKHQRGTGAIETGAGIVLGFASQGKLQELNNQLDMKLERGEAVTIGDRMKQGGLVVTSTIAGVATLDGLSRMATQQGIGTHIKNAASAVSAIHAGR